MKKFFTPLFIVLMSSSAHAQQWDVIAEFNQVIWGLESFDGKLFIAGGFTQYEGSTSYWSAYYENGTVTPHTSLIGGTGLSKLEAFNGDLYCTSALDHGGSTGVSRWSGSTWTGAASFNTNYTGIYADGNDLYVGGYQGQIAKKTGTGIFTAMPYTDDSNDHIYEITKYGSDIIIGGKFTSANAVTLNNIGYWDGSAWQALGTGTSSDVWAMAEYNGELYVGGKFTTAGGVAAKHIAKWNGTTWSDVGGSMTGTGFNGVRDMIVFDNKLYVCGDFDEMGGVAANDVAYWDGSTWHAVGFSTPSSFANAFTEYNNNLYVATFDFDTTYVYGMDIGSGGAGITDINPDVAVTAYPNPVVDELLITANQNIQSIVINDLNGQLIYQENVQAVQQVKLDASSFPSAVYLLTITTDAGVSTIRIAKD